MARTETLSNALAQAYANTAVQVSFHSDDPGPDGTANEILTRQSLTWPTAPSGGAVTSGNVTVAVPNPDPDLGGTVLTHVGIWGTGNVFLEAVPNDLTFETATNYVFNVMDQE